MIKLGCLGTTVRLLFIAAAASGAVLALASCATMSAEQCLAGDWSGQGYADGVSGLTMSRLDEHAEACVKHGITPDGAAYATGREQGLVRYCTLDNGFQQGRSGSGYGGVCPSHLEADFLPAYRDGQIVHAAEQALADARSSVNSLGARLEELDDKITGKQAELRAEGLTDEQREQIRNRIQEIRRERADTERDWRRAQDAIDDFEREVRDVRYRFRGQYGGW
jgi:Spy/CpxP family protein refolding chaperone